MALFADLNLTNGEAAAVGQDFVQHLGQNQRIDDMPAQFDLFGKHKWRVNLAQTIGSAIFVQPRGLAQLALPRGAVRENGWKGFNSLAGCSARSWRPLCRRTDLEG